MLNKIHFYNRLDQVSTFFGRAHSSSPEHKSKSHNSKFVFLVQDAMTNPNQIGLDAVMEKNKSTVQKPSALQLTFLDESALI